MSELISVIVPVYNVEKHLEKCIRSILCQSYTNIELILVDDGSKDNSGAMCDTFASEDSRVRVIHKANGGVAAARNTGILEKKGDFYCFVDSDDTVHPNYIANLYKIITEYNADISMSAYLYAWDDGRKKRTRNAEYPDNHIFTDTGRDALGKMLYSKIYAPACYSKLFRSSKIKVHFPPYAIGEDMLAAVDYLMQADTVVMSNEPHYYYLQNDESVMHSVNPDKVFDLVTTGDEMMKIVPEKCPENKSAAAYYIVEKNMDAYFKISTVSGQKDKLERIKANIKKYAPMVAADSNAHMHIRKDCKAVRFGIPALKAYRKAKAVTGRIIKYVTNELPTVIVNMLSFLPRHNIIIFESIPSFADNTYWFFKYLVENTDIEKRYKLVWRVRTADDVRDELCGRKIKCIVKNAKTAKQKIELGYYWNFAKFIVDCNDYVYKKHPKQKRVFLGHGMPVKIVKDYDLLKGDVDMNMITTYNLNSHFYDIGDKDENMRNFGYCRTDVLYEHAGIRQDRDKTYIIWMPTYRQHTRADSLRIENNFPLGLPVIKSTEQMAEINEFLKENNTVLYLRPHPAQDVSVMKLDEMSNIVIADNKYLNGTQIYDFLTGTDALITDYSSVYYDYLMIDRPIALAVEDLEEFSAKWPMYFKDFKANYICPYIDTVDDLKKFIKDVATDNDEFREERLKAKHRFYDYTDGKTCERIYNFMVKEYKM
ncbi:MAG: CDP-glycerol glycerophosphotransferase family protein [Clostridia bacterium]|nr:CDP-glycerol glycerophosphotransferase family protein [Clostridia bacterium]